MQTTMLFSGDVKKDLTLLMKKYSLMPKCSGQIAANIANGSVSTIDINELTRIK